jgi:hypothetical protein
MKQLALILAAVLLALPVQAVTIDRYAWQFPQAGGIVGAEDLTTLLQEEVQKILDAGHLASLYISRADQDSVGYKEYFEPGRIIATLAWAYPHLTAAQQTAVRSYVVAELADSRYVPWSSNLLPDMVGTPRELHTKTKWWYERNDILLYRPRIHTIYGLWLYAYRSGDWALVQGNWSSIKSFYAARSGEANLYGTMSAHIAMARLADHFSDSAARATALNNLQTQLDSGLTLSVVEAQAVREPAWSSAYRSNPDMYDSRMDDSTYRGWIFLNLSPEIGRYLAQENSALKDAVITRHNLGKAMFPHWWVNSANYFNRSWTGDEGSGLVPDVYGMLAPVERWVVGSSAAELRRELKSTPTGIGDCYWLEALVQGIEAHGQVIWTDVRTGTPDTAPPKAPANLRMR